VKLFLRTFADCESQEAAHAISARILLALSAFSPQQAREPQPYWKLPHLFEFTFLLEPATESSLEEVVAMSSGSWEHSRTESELSSVWNRRNDHAFLVPEVSWAEIQLYEAAA